MKHQPFTVIHKHHKYWNIHKHSKKETDKQQEMFHVKQTTNSTEISNCNNKIKMINR